jgi:probable HAF family extracellular repeat protein
MKRGRLPELPVEPKIFRDALRSRMIEIRLIPERTMIHVCSTRTASGFGCVSSSQHRSAGRTTGDVTRRLTLIAIRCPGSSKTKQIKSAIGRRTICLTIASDLLSFLHFKVSPMCFWPLPAGNPACPIGRRLHSNAVPLRFRHVLCAVLLLSALFATARAEAAYTAVELAVLEQGSTRVVRGVNDYGEGVGGSQLGKQPRGFITSSRGLEILAGLPGSDHTVALGLNSAGVVVGSSNTASGLRAFRFIRGIGAVDLGTLPGDANSAAFAVNNGGKATGYSSGTSGIRAVVWTSNNSIQLLPALAGSNSSRGLAINEQGDVVGVSEIAGAPHAVRWQGANLQDLGSLPGDASTEALAINNQGDIVGSSGNVNAARRAVLWTRAGAIQNLGILAGGNSSRALGISDRGVVVGTSESSNGTHAFIWTSREGMQDLNDVLTSRGGFVLTHAVSISSQGLILAIGHDDVSGAGHGADGHTHDQHELQMRIFLLTPAP